MHSSSTPKYHSSQSGATLIVTLILLAAVMIISIHAFKRITLAETMAGSSMDKPRSFHVAEAALRHGERELSRDPSLVGKQCPRKKLPGLVGKLPVDCERFNDSWNGAMTLEFPHMHISTEGGLHTSGDIYYFSKPQWQFSYLGDRYEKEFFYEVTAKGYGGNPGTYSVLQSTFSLNINHTDLGSLKPSGTR